MSNELPNGAILPSGLLDASPELMAGFKKTYQNSSLRIGVIRESYGAKNSKNISKLVTEYDVMVFEQNEDKGATVITYKNCMASQSFGSLADYFEANLRKIKKKTSKGETPNISGHNGAVVLLLCLDSMSEKGLIIGSWAHPDRKSKLIDDSPYLEGEYNGVNIKVDTDGSTQLIFKGATDNDGKLIDSSQGPTTIRIEKDGSFQVDHKTITLRLDKNGVVSLTSDGSINIDTKKDITINATGNATLNCKDVTVTSSGNATIKAKEAILEASGTAIVEAKTVKLGKGATESVIKGDAFKTFYEAHTHPTALGPSGPPLVKMPASTLSKKVKVE